MSNFVYEHYTHDWTYRFTVLTLKCMQEIRNDIYLSMTCIRTGTCYPKSQPDDQVAQLYYTISTEDGTVHVQWVTDGSDRFILPSDNLLPSREECMDFLVRNWQ